MSDQDQVSNGMLDHLQSLLRQLEEAGGAGPDAEAREALKRLQTSLQTLENAQAGQLENIPSYNSPEMSSLPRDMENLQGRLSNLERRMEALGTGTHQIINGAAGEWLQQQLGSNMENLSGGFREQQGEEESGEGGSGSSGAQIENNKEPAEMLHCGNNGNSKERTEESVAFDGEPVGTGDV